jgi:UV DNA damage endonuclease
MGETVRDTMRDTMRDTVGKTAQLPGQCRPGSPAADALLRLGFAVRVVGQPGLRSHDSRRTAPHLSVSLAYLRDVVLYLQQLDIRYYRIASGLLPAASVAAGIGQLTACRAELAAVAAQARAAQVRLTAHLDTHIALGSPDDRRAACSLEQIELQAALLEQLGTPAESVLVAHLGGSPHDPATFARFACRYQALSARARACLAVEHDTVGFSLGAALRLHQQCGVPVVFDALHWQLANPERLPFALALGLALATWPAERRPEVHLSSARSEAHLLPRRGGGSRVVPPRPGQHADFITVADMLRLLHAARSLPPFDILLEAKAGDLALLRARADVARQAPELAARLA